MGSFGIMQRAEVYPYLTEDLNHAIRLWKDYRRFGLPHGRGYMSETEEYLALIDLFEDKYEEAVDQIRKQRMKQQAKR